MLRFFRKFHFGELSIHTPPHLQLATKISISEISKLHFDTFHRWFNRIAKIGNKRELNEDDIYAVKDGMQSARNTDEFAKEWQTELEKENPSIVRALFRLYGFKTLLVTFLYAIGTTLAGYISYLKHINI